MSETHAHRTPTRRDPRLGRHRQDVPVEQPLHRPGRPGAAGHDPGHDLHPQGGGRDPRPRAAAAGRGALDAEETGRAGPARRRSAARPGPLPGSACSAMVRQLHRLRVSTLDSFFIQIAQSFGLELGLPPGWEIADEIDDRRSARKPSGRCCTMKRRTDVVKLMHLLDQGRGRALGERADRRAGHRASTPSIARPRPKPGNRCRGRSGSPRPNCSAAVAALEHVPLPAESATRRPVPRTWQRRGDDDWETFPRQGAGSEDPRRHGEVLRQAHSARDPGRLSPAGRACQGGAAGPHCRSDRGHL